MKVENYILHRHDIKLLHEIVLNPIQAFIKKLNKKIISIRQFYYFYKNVSSLIIMMHYHILFSHGGGPLNKCYTRWTSARDI